MRKLLLYYSLRKNFERYTKIRCVTLLLLCVSIVSYGQDNDGIIDSVDSVDLDDDNDVILDTVGGSFYRVACS